MNRTSYPFRCVVALLASVGPLGGCSDENQSTAPVTAAEPTMQERMQGLFESVLDGVQLIEANDKVPKSAGAVDDRSTPPHYMVTYAGCVEGYVGGTFCVQDGQHRIDMLTPELHIIRSVEQRYLLDRFGSVPNYTMTGELESHVAVEVDTDAQTTNVEGTAAGDLVVAGDVEGTVEVALTIGGGRNYTESTATPIVVTGTLTYKGETFQVQGGFQRE